MRSSIIIILLAACGSSPDGGQPTVDGGTDSNASIDGSGGQVVDGATTGDAIVFITSNFYDGDLKTAGAGTSGLDGADKLCQLHADAASLPGTYRAWLSTTTTNAIDRITGPGPWKNTHDQIVFGNRAQLQTHPLINVGYDESGDPLYPRVWTGTDVGRAAPPEFNANTNATCEDWTSKSPSDPRAAYGDSGEASSGAWSRNGYDSCYLEHAFFCFAISG